MTTELLLSVTLGLGFITVGVYFLWRAGSDRRRQARLQAQYGLYAARDHVIRMAASGKLNPESDLFAGLVDWINVVIAFDNHADFDFYRWLIKTGITERARDNATRMVTEAVGPNFHEDEVTDLVEMVGTAVHNAICANSRMVRLFSKIGTFDGNTTPEPMPMNIGSVSLTALPTLTNRPAFS
jgi:hypothetical protein